VRTSACPSSIAKGVQKHRPYPTPVAARSRAQGQGVIICGRAGWGVGLGGEVRKEGLGRGEEEGLGGSCKSRCKNRQARM
jgi:hypothetical protein